MTSEQAKQLDGLRVLVVEDVAMVAWLVRDVLRNAGADVAGPVSDVALALALLSEQEVDAAVLDKNLNGETSDPIADALVARKVPFVFLTGYGSDDTQGRHAERPTLGKPLKPDSAREAARALASQAVLTLPGEDEFVVLVARRIDGERVGIIGVVPDDKALMDRALRAIAR